MSCCRRSIDSTSAENVENTIFGCVLFLMSAHFGGGGGGINIVLEKTTINDNRASRQNQITRILSTSNILKSEDISISFLSVLNIQENEVMRF